jgi:hypothetical protein
MKLAVLFMITFFVPMIWLARVLDRIDEEDN